MPFTGWLRRLDEEPSTNGMKKNKSLDSNIRQSIKKFMPSLSLSD